MGDGVGDGVDSGGSDQWFFFDAHERTLVAAVFAHLDATEPERLVGMRDELERLAGLARLLRDDPPLARAWQLVARPGPPAEALLALLGRVPHYNFELHVPTKVVLGQGYLLGKVNFLTALDTALLATQGPLALHDECQNEIGQSIHSKMGEELFVAILTDLGTPRAVRLRAAESLLRIWDDPLQTEIDDFAPLLEAAWSARVRVRPVLGAMLGVQEVMQLFQQATDERFLMYFERDGLPQDELFAFEEFIFGLSHEEIIKLREHIEAESSGLVSRSQAMSLIGSETGAWVLDGQGPRALFASYRRRRRKAQARVITGASGPKRTAEEYVLLALLSQNIAT